MSQSSENTFVSYMDQLTKVSQLSLNFNELSVTQQLKELYGIRDVFDIVLNDLTQKYDDFAQYDSKIYQKENAELDEVYKFVKTLF